MRAPREDAAKLFVTYTLGKEARYLVGRGARGLGRRAFLTVTKWNKSASKI